MLTKKRNTEAVEDPMTMKDLVKMCIGGGALVVGVILLFNFVLILNLFPSGSMENTIMTSDVVIATRFDRTDVQRYDIMVFEPTDKTDAEYYIKRVIGLPGETILVKDGKIYAGHELLDDSFVPEQMGRSGDGVYEVPEGCYFMLGDNRNHSADARFWENKYVPLENMVAKARIIVFPFTRIGGLRYQGAGNTAVSAEEGVHGWTAAPESGSAELTLNCQSCGQHRRLKELQIQEEPDGGCAQHRIALAENIYIRKGENGFEQVVASVSLHCKDCGWSATAVPDGEG